LAAAVFLWIGAGSQTPVIAPLAVALARVIGLPKNRARIDTRFLHGFGLSMRHPLEM
jgi:hypothetical protein